MHLHKAEAERKRLIRKHQANIEASRREIDRLMKQAVPVYEVKNVKRCK